MLNKMKSSSAGARNKYLDSLVQIAISFFFGFLFVVILIMIGGGIFIGKKSGDKIQKTQTFIEAPLTTYDGAIYSISYPQNYEFSENKIIGTEGIITEQANTIHLISPTLPGSDGNLSMIITYVPLKEFEDEKENGSTTCPELYEKELTPLKIGEFTFTQSGLINCGPNEVAFFYVINDKKVYEAKVETTADYVTKAYPQVIKILKTIKFKEE